MNSSLTEEEMGGNIPTKQIRSFSITDLSGEKKIFNSRSIKGLRSQVAESFNTCSMCISLRTSVGEEVMDNCVTSNADFFCSSACGAGGRDEIVG